MASECVCLCVCVVGSRTTTNCISVIIMAASSCKSVAPLRQSDFSIEHILTRAGERYSKRRKLSNEVGGCRNCCSTNSSSSSSNSSPRSVRSEEGEGDDNDNGGRLRDEPGTEADEELDEEIDVGQSVMQHPGQEAGFLPTAPSCGMPTFDWLYYTRYHPPKLPRKYLPLFSYKSEQVTPVRSMADQSLPPSHVRSFFRSSENGSSQANARTFAACTIYACPAERTGGRVQSVHLPELRGSEPARLQSRADQHAGENLVPKSARPRSARKAGSIIDNRWGGVHVHLRIAPNALYVAAATVRHCRKCG